MKYNNQSINKLRFIEHNRFLQIYLLSLKLPSWDIIGLNLMGFPITEEEYEFVISKTRKQGDLQNVGF